MKFKLDRKSLETIYFAFILPVAEYGKIHVDAMQFVTGATSRSSIQRLYAETGWQTIRSRIDMAMIVMLFKIKNQSAPNYLYDLLPK